MKYDDETVEFYVDQFMTAWKRRGSTTYARNGINNQLPADKAEINARLESLLKTTRQNPISNQSYRG